MTILCKSLYFSLKISNFISGRTNILIMHTDTSLNETFRVRCYSKSELASLYFPGTAPDVASQACAAGSTVAPRWSPNSFRPVTSPVAAISLRVRSVSSCITWVNLNYYNLLVLRKGIYHIQWIISVSCIYITVRWRLFRFNSNCFCEYISVSIHTLGLRNFHCSHERKFLDACFLINYQNYKLII